MTTFQLIHPTSEASALAALLARHGAEPADKGDLLVLTAASLPEARAQLSRLSGPERARCLIMGLSETLEVHIPSPDNFEGLLDEFLPLGVLTFGADPQRGDVFDFIGKKSVAESMGMPYGKMTTSRHYAGYIMIRNEDAGAFVLRCFRAATRPPAPPSG